MIHIQSEADEITGEMASCLFTMTCSARANPAQAIPDKPTPPSPDAAMLRIRLIMEEALEIAASMKMRIKCNRHDGVVNSVGDLDIEQYAPITEADMPEIVDAFLDTRYVATGGLAMMGIADGLVMRDVCHANNTKMVNGEPLTAPNGKFLKPPGWLPPNAAPIIRAQKMDLRQLGEHIRESVMAGNTTSALYGYYI